MKIEEQIVKYFNGKFIGSYIFYEKNLLDYNDINDIDIAVLESRLHNIYSFLKDNGYKEKHDLKSVFNYELFRNQIIFKKESYKTIHLCIVNNNFEVFDIYKLIAQKLKRNKISDFNQIIKVINNLRENIKI